MRVKVKANAMEDADVKYVSLVSRPASRIPFRITKSDDPKQENGLMINFTKMFKRDGDEPKAIGPVLAGVVLQKQHESHFGPKLKELGLKIDDRVEVEDLVILRQCEYEDDEIVTIKLNEMGGLFKGVPEEVLKGFDPMAESDKFEDNMAKGFLPGMSAATEALFDTVMTVLRTSENPQDASTRISSTIDSYKQAIMDMAQKLPEIAFKMDAMDLSDFEVVDLTGDDDTETVTDGAAAEETVQKAAEDDGLTDAERETLKSVHIESLDEPEMDEANELTEESTEAPVEKEETSEPNPLDAIMAKMGDVLEAVAGVRTEVADLKLKQDELTEKVDKAEEAAETATKAVKSTVPSSSDAGDIIPNESLGTRSRQKTADDGMWGGTSLDRIVGDYS